MFTWDHPRLLHRFSTVLEIILVLALYKLSVCSSEPHLKLAHPQLRPPALTPTQLKRSFKLRFSLFVGFYCWAISPVSPPPRPLVSFYSTRVELGGGGCQRQKSLSSFIFSTNDQTFLGFTGTRRTGHGYELKSRIAVVVAGSDSEIFLYYSFFPQIFLRWPKKPSPKPHKATILSPSCVCRPFWFTVFSLDSD